MPRPMEGIWETPDAGARARVQRVLAVVCAWCRRSLGVRPASAATAGAVSHGLCGACAQRLARPFEA